MKIPFKDPIRRIIVCVWLVTLCCPNLVTAEILTFEHQQRTFSIDTMSAFCKLNAEEQSKADEGNELFRSMGKSPSIIILSACENFKQLPYSNVNVRWQGQVPAKLSPKSVKEALEDNFKKQIRISTDIKDLIARLTEEFTKPIILETSNEQAIIYFEMKAIPTTESIDSTTIMSFGSYTYVIETGDIFIVSLVTPKTQDFLKAQEALNLLGKISESIKFVE